VAFASRPVALIRLLVLVAGARFELATLL
jgi:hypothetical protein